MMSQHVRLGTLSIASRIDALLMTMIVDIVMGRPAFQDNWDAHFKLINQTV